MLSYFALYGAVFMLGILLLMFSKNKKTLSSSDKKKFISYLKEIQKQNSARDQIIRYDALYHKILQAYGYQGSFGEILKQQPSVISDIQLIWELHKLRNKLVHELENLADSQLQKKSTRYHSEITALVNS